MVKTKFFELTPGNPVEHTLESIRELLKETGSEISVALNKDTLMVTYDTDRGGMPWKVSAFELPEGRRYGMTLRSQSGTDADKMQEWLDAWFKKLAPVRLLGTYMNDSVLLVFYR